MGATEQAVRQLMKDNGEPVGAEAVLGEVALKLAKAIDDPGTDMRQLPNLTKELRLALKQLQEGQSGGEDDEWSDLATAE